MKWIWFASPRPLGDIDRYEAAGRSPWGAFKLLCKRSADTITSIGAIITILSLAIDPFSQQVLQFYSCPQPAAGMSATVLRTNNYTTSDLSNNLSEKMTAALYQGVLASSTDTSSTFATSCPSGNCTFAGLYYTSLAMCSSVRDISDTVIEDNYAANEYIYTLPSGVNITYSTPLVTMPKDIVKLGNWSSEDMPMFSMEILMAGRKCKYEVKTNPSQSTCTTEGRAFYAALSPCAHTYGNISYSNAIFKQQLLSTHMLAATKVDSLSSSTGYYSLAGDFPPYPGVDCTPSKSPRGRKLRPTSPLSNGLRYAHRRPGDASVVADVLYFDDRCTYEFSHWSAVRLSALLGYKLFGNIGYGNSLSGLVGIGLGADAIGDKWLRSLWENGMADLASGRDSWTASRIRTRRLSGARGIPRTARR